MSFSFKDGIGIGLSVGIHLCLLAAIWEQNAVEVSSYGRASRAVQISLMSNSDKIKRTAKSAQIRKVFPKQGRRPEKSKKKSREYVQKPTERELEPFGFDLASSSVNLSSNLKAYFTDLRFDIERNKIYPKLARRLKQSGIVHVKFDISKEGQISNVNVKKQCPFHRLNEAALELLSSLKKQYPLPDEINAEKISVVLPINYILQ